MTKKPAFKPLKAQTLKDTVYQELFQAIVSGRLEPGTRLVLETVAQQLGVSIMPVREAIRKLEAGELVTVQNRRITVKELSVQNVADILKVRILLEGYAASEATRFVTPEILTRAEEYLAEMDRTDDIEEYLLANRAFHNTIYRASGNPILQETIDTLWKRYSPYLHILLDNLLDWKTEAYQANHLGMLDSLRAGDGEGVRDWVEQDLKQAARAILEMLQAKDNDFGEED